MPSAPKRLIEVAFPLKQTSLDSVHEKNVRHGHISTLHIWPARRPLAACRAALIATLLPDPGDPVERKQILDRLAGKVVQRVKRKKTDTGWVEEVSEETEGGILHWGRESGPDLDWFRQKIRAAYGGRAPKVLDPFAGGGAIPLEAMRLGCEATAMDINPVAWFILKCTLEYPQKLAGKKRPLPDFAVHDREFMQDYLKAQGFKGAALEAQLHHLGLADQPLQKTLPGMGSSTDDSQLLTENLLSADLAWHVRAWGRWVLRAARKELAPYYPTYADFEPLVEVTGKVERRPMTLVPLKEDGTPDIVALNTEFTPEYLVEKRNPRWVAKPIIAYLWARTVICKNCRAVIPLLKTMWLCKKDNKRVLLTMQTNTEKTGVVFGVQNDVPIVGKTAAEKKDHDAKVGGGTMSRSGSTCPCCGLIMTRVDIQQEGIKGVVGEILTTAIVIGNRGKEYRLTTILEKKIGEEIKPLLDNLFSGIPFSIPKENLTVDAKGDTWCTLYGTDTFDKLFSSRQLFAMGTFVKNVREARKHLSKSTYSRDWENAIFSYLSCVISKLADYENIDCVWYAKNEQISHLFNRFVIPMKWDFAEASPIGGASGSWESMLSSVSKSVDIAISLPTDMIQPNVLFGSATKETITELDLIITDPPYYDSIGYSVLMDFFYVWLRRLLNSFSVETDNVFHDAVTLKWDYDQNDGELVDDASRFGGNKQLSKQSYEDGMFKSFQACFKSLKADGRLVVVFANKQPEAWETLVSAVIRANFVVDGSWPIQTEMSNRTRAHVGAALASSVWLVCKKRPLTSRPGWDNKVLDEMRTNIATHLRDFWDAGIRGPDFVWAASGPAMEAYSQYPVVKKANESGAVMTVAEFLTHVRRMVVDFVVGRVLNVDGAEDVTGLDNITTYYLLHRHDFGLNDAPAGPCILYAVSCGLSDKDLADRYDLLARRGGKEQEEAEGVEEGDTLSGAGEETEGSGSSFRLKAWNQRKHPNMGYDPRTDSSPEKLPLFPDMEREVQPSREIPLIDQIHRLMLLWKGGDVSKVNEYLDLRGLRRNPLFHQLLQALIELALVGSQERALMESISNHVVGNQVKSPTLF